MIDKKVIKFKKIKNKCMNVTKIIFISYTIKAYFINLFIYSTTDISGKAASVRDNYLMDRESGVK